MQDLPDKTLLLEAVSGFLTDQVASSTEDRVLRFRLRIAAHILQTVVHEIRAEEAHDLAELERLAEVCQFDGQPPSSRADQVAVIRRLNADLATRLRSGTPDIEAQAAIRATLMATLRDKLSVNQPRFDLRLDVEPA